MTTGFLYFVLGGAPLLVIVAALIGPAMVKGLVDRHREN